MRSSAAFNSRLPLCSITAKTERKKKKKLSLIYEESGERDRKSEGRRSLEVVDDDSDDLS